MSRIYIYINIYIYIYRNIVGEDASGGGDAM